jgi:hypothetical protein
MCVGEWSSKGFVKDIDIKIVVSLPEVDGEEGELQRDWDAISIDDSE